MSSLLAPPPTAHQQQQKSLLARRIILLPSKLPLSSLQKQESPSPNRKVLTEQTDNHLPCEEFAVKSNPEDHSGLDILEEERMRAPEIFHTRPHMIDLNLAEVLGMGRGDAGARDRERDRERWDIMRKEGGGFYQKRIKEGVLQEFEKHHEQAMEVAASKAKKVIKLKSRRYDSGLECDNTKQLKTSRKTKETHSLQTRISKGGIRFIQVTLANSPFGHDNTSAWLTPHKTKSQYHNSLLMSSAHHNRTANLSKSLGIKIISRSLKRQATEPILSPGCFRIQGACCPIQGDLDPADTREVSERSLKRSNPKPIKPISHILARKPKPIKLFKNSKLQSFLR